MMDSDVSSEPVTRSVSVPKTILDRQHLNEWLMLQKREQEVALETARSLRSLSNDVQDPELQKENILALQKKLADVLSVQSSKQLIVKRMQLGSELLKYLYPHAVQDGAGDGPVIDNQKQRSIKTLLEQQTYCVTEILEKRKKLEEKKAQLGELRSKNREIQIQNRERMHDIKEKKEAPLGKEIEKYPEVQNAKQNLSKVVDKITVERHLFQGLISASGINWAKDPELADLMIQLGETPKFE
ncbi:centromere protein H-like [Lineus longissimus]|uniref:centromere protein H-like n=1 Tax=Lineus longissimus TaxID=88925 RepID=UPI002B4E98FF